MNGFIAVIDYGLGNLRSVSKALEIVGAQVKLTNSAQEIIQAQAVVLPGVGAFKRAMDNLNSLGIISSIKTVIQAGRPFLGICLGLQVLFTQSQEHGSCPGLDIISGEVNRFNGGVKIPHMGWNQVDLKAETLKSQIFQGIPDRSYFYFVHSYFVQPQQQDVAAATTQYGQEFVSVVHKDNVWGVQFHPEKSADLGLQILKNFVNSI